MIVEIDNGKIKNIDITGSFRSLKKGEIFVPNGWGTDDILSFFSNNADQNKQFFIKKNPDDQFSLFDVDADFDISNYMNVINPSFPNNEFSLIEI